MWQQQLLNSLWLAGAISVVVVQPVWAQAIQVTEVQFQPTASGLEVILQTADGALPRVFTSSTNQTLILDISNAQLTLPSGNELRKNNPVEGITLVTVKNLNANSIQIRVKSETGLPQVKVSESKQGLLLSLTPAFQTGESPSALAPETPATQLEEEGEGDITAEEEEEIEILVTGEQETGYTMPETANVTRTNISILNIPRSIQVVPEQVIEDQQVIRLEEALRNVSNVFQENTGGDRTERFTIRGFRTTNVLRDGFRQFGQAGFAETANLERIEVLKGPASIFYGNTEPGGTINLVTKKPLPEPFVEPQLQVGSYDFFRPQIDATGPLTSDGRLLYRLNTVSESGGNFRDFDQDINRFFIAPVLTWNISDRTNLTVELEYLNDERPFDRGIIALGDGVIDLPINRIIGEPDDYVNSEDLSVSYRLEHRFSDNWNLRNAFRYQRRDVSLFATQAAAYGEGPEGLSGAGILQREYASLNEFDEAYSLQTNVVGEFATGSVGHTLTFGVDLVRNSFEQIARVSQPPLFPASLNIFNPVYGVLPRPDVDDLSTFLNTDLRTDRLGIYLQDQIAFAPNVQLLLGGRFDYIDQALRNSPTASDPTSSEANPTNDAFSPQVGIVYKPIEPISLYASYSRSFEPNSGTTASGEFLEPERGTQYEVGVKADLLDGRLFTTLAFYHLTRSNVATSDLDNLGASIAVGEQRSQGIELDIIGEILPGWNIIAGYAYNDAEITEDNEYEVGNRLYNVPKHSASLWTTYEIQSGDLQGLGFGIGFNYVGERAGDLENSYEVPSYFLTNAAIYYQQDNWRAALNFKNLFDIDYYVHAFGRQDIKPGAPFTVVGSLSVEF
ncbi:TonB-dependent siderophore receptor [Chroococcidiopsis sp. CCMEE 29]|uniref:TonB-dependent siderophore receptor n=1 Tax=Chroococcidiopsis sp. CCMEE 29 TaxID=155894 RepID=UPI002020A87B|nr:TonB-dependent siderophore receptor [Chroococcidiopsis sp. CCMEE 29]